MFPYLSNVRNTRQSGSINSKWKSIKGAGLEISSLNPCNMEEVDSDVVVTAIDNFHQLASLNELWTEFGTGKLLRIITTHQRKS